jgi:hypothetical protein
MKTWACFDDGFKFLALLWAFIEESRLDRPKSSFVGLSLMVHVSLGLSFGPSWDTLWANAYKLGLCSFDDSVHGCHESVGMESFLRKLVVQSLFVHTGSVIWGDFVCSAR